MKKKEYSTLSEYLKERLAMFPEERNQLIDIILDKSWWLSMAVGFSIYIVTIGLASFLLPYLQKSQTCFYSKDFFSFSSFCYDVPQLEIPVSLLAVIGGIIIAVVFFVAQAYYTERDTGRVLVKQTKISHAFFFLILGIIIFTINTNSSFNNIYVLSLAIYIGIIFWNLYKIILNEYEFNLAFEKEFVDLAGKISINDFKERIGNNFLREYFKKKLSSSILEYEPYFSLRNSATNYHQEKLIYDECVITDISFKKILKIQEYLESTFSNILEIESSPYSDNQQVHGEKENIDKEPEPLVVMSFEYQKLRSDFKIFFKKDVLDETQKQYVIKEVLSALVIEFDYVDLNKDYLDKYANLIDSIIRNLKSGNLKLVERRLETVVLQIESFSKSLIEANEEKRMTLKQVKNEIGIFGSEFNILGKVSDDLATILEIALKENVPDRLIRHIIYIPVRLMSFALKADEMLTFSKFNSLLQHYYYIVRDKDSHYQNKITFYLKEFVSFYIKKDDHKPYLFVVLKSLQDMAKNKIDSKELTIVVEIVDLIKEATEPRRFYRVNETYGSLPEGIKMQSQIFLGLASWLVYKQKEQHKKLEEDEISLLKNLLTYIEVENLKDAQDLYNDVKERDEYSWGWSWWEAETKMNMKMGYTARFDNVVLLTILLKSISTSGFKMEYDINDIDKIRDKNNLLYSIKENGEIRLALRDAMQISPELKVSTKESLEKYESDLEDIVQLLEVDIEEGYQKENMSDTQLSKFIADLKTDYSRHRSALVKISKHFQSYNEKIELFTATDQDRFGIFRNLLDRKFFIDTNIIYSGLVSGHVNSLRNGENKFLVEKIKKCNPEEIEFKELISKVKNGSIVIGSYQSTTDLKTNGWSVDFINQRQEYIDEYIINSKNEYEKIPVIHCPELPDDEIYIIDSGFIKSFERNLSESGEEVIFEFNDLVSDDNLRSTIIEERPKFLNNIENSNSYLRKYLLINFYEIFRFEVDCKKIKVHRLKSESD